MYKEYAHIKEKGKCEDDDVILNELYLGKHRAKTFPYFIETKNYIYYLQDDDPTIIVRVEKRLSSSEFIIVGFNQQHDADEEYASRTKIVVNTSDAKMSMFGEISQTEPVMEATFDSLTDTWDVRYNLDVKNEPSNLTEALEKYKKRDPIHGPQLEKTINDANTLFKTKRIKDQKRMNKSPKSYN